MPEELVQLLEKARNTRMTDDQKEDQKISFAYGNTHFENADITREIVEAEAKKLRDTGSQD